MTRTPQPLLACSGFLVAIACLSGVRAQDDLRDVVTLENGATLRGRVLSRYEPGVVKILVGRRRHEVPRADVVAMDTVRDRVREYFALLDRLPGNLRHRWFMAQWAADRGLHDLARLTALDIVLRDPDHEEAPCSRARSRSRTTAWVWSGWRSGRATGDSAVWCGEPDRRTRSEQRAGWARHAQTHQPPLPVCSATPNRPSSAGPSAAAAPRMAAEVSMKRVTGIGGVFFKAEDAPALQEWYRRHLGIDVQEWGGTAFTWADSDGEPTGGTTVWSVSPRASDQFAPSEASFMINYRVDDLHALVAALRAEGCNVLDKVDESDFGKFAWVIDPEGNKVELWQPPAGQ